MLFYKNFMMAYYKKPEYWTDAFGESYQCDHQLYDWCTLYTSGDRGLAIIQQRFDSKTKKSWWGVIDPWLASDIYLNPKFKNYFNKNAGVKDVNGCYPTVCVRQIMRALGMLPLEKEFWETRF